MLYDTSNGQLNQYIPAPKSTNNTCFGIKMSYPIYIASMATYQPPRLTEDGLVHYNNCGASPRLIIGTFFIVAMS